MADQRDVRAQFTYRNLDFPRVQRLSDDADVRFAFQDARQADPHQMVRVT
ncbi:hypothetical protein [Streptomyces xanthophaeus]|nr:hypothetical protein [Streptomyces xanthophaeus]WST25160.1 hypothetical protein OG264_28840 [Streptomyces xanthophaeus]WST59866.1 hypothetical protein OG605_09600 [Streptomyces xanthophaeus]